MYCENCGALIPEDSKFCPECGNVIQPAPEPASPHCPNCGAEIEPDSYFCENCGHKLSGQQSAGRDIPPVPERPRSTYMPSAPSAVSEQPRTSNNPPVPPAPVRQRERSIPSAPQAAVRETVRTKEAKPKNNSGRGCIVALILLVLLFCGCSRTVKNENPGNYPYELDTPAPAPHDGTFVSEHGSMRFTGNDETVVIEFDKELAALTGLPQGEKKGTYVFLSGNLPPNGSFPVRYDIAHEMQIKVGGKVRRDRHGDRVRGW